MATNAMLMGGMNAPKEKTSGVTVNLRVATRDRFSDFCRDNGVIQADLLARIIEWFISLDASTQALLTKKISEEDSRELATIVLQRIANENTATTSSLIIGPTAKRAAKEHSHSGGKTNPSNREQ